MEYKVISVQAPNVTDAIKQLEKKVQDYCLHGWIPHGGISVVTKSYEFYFAFQAMTKDSLE